MSAFGMIAASSLDSHIFLFVASSNSPMYLRTSVSTALCQENAPYRLPSSNWSMTAFQAVIVTPFWYGLRRSH